jgi:ADP-heptose:LPS heptosyltransferase
VPAAERILLVRLSHLGDVVHALPVYHALRRGFPEARIAWAVQPEYAELIAPLSGLERTFAFDRRGGARAWLALRDELGAFEPTLVVDAQGNLKSALVCLAAGSGTRVGPAYRDWREPAGGFAMHARAARAGGEHALDRMLALARRAVPRLEGQPSFDLELAPAELARGAARVRELLPGAARAVVVQAGDPADVRSWPAEHTAELARTLARAGTAVLLLSGPQEERAGRELERALAGEPRVAHWVGQRGLRELAGFCAAAAVRGARFLGADSGPLHLAAACGMAVTCLAGPQSHLRTGPWPVPERAGGPPPCAARAGRARVRAVPRARVHAPLRTGVHARHRARAGRARVRGCPTRIRTIR